MFLLPTPCHKLPQMNDITPSNLSHTVQLMNPSQEVLPCVTLAASQAFVNFTEMDTQAGSLDISLSSSKERLVLFLFTAQASSSTAAEFKKSPKEQVSVSANQGRHLCHGP